MDRNRDFISSLREIFKDSRRAHASANAHGNQTIAPASTLQFADYCRRQLCARATQRMSKGDRSAIWIHAPGIESASLITASDWAAKASFNSITSMSLSFRPASFNAFGIAKTGPSPISSGL